MFPDLGGGTTTARLAILGIRAGWLQWGGAEEATALAAPDPIDLLHTPLE